MELILTKGGVAIMFENLCKPITIGNHVVKNRMKYAATVDNFCDTKNGNVIDREIEYLRERAKGGFGIVVSQGGYTHILGKGYVGQMGLVEESHLAGLKVLADAINAEGAMSIGQIMHTGRYGHAHEYGIHEAIAGGKTVGPEPVGPTAMSSPIKRYSPCREMTNEEIEEQIQAHIVAARMFKQTGWHGVEVCAIVGYLIADFLSRWTNKRTDKWGGSLENRARFLIEILKGIRAEVGDDYPLVMRLNATDLIEGGNTNEEYIEIAKMCEAAVRIDLFSITVGWHESPGAAITAEKRPGDWLHLADEWKKAKIKSPICMAYRMNQPDVAEKAVADGRIDIWEMCRPGIADPYLPKKVIEGRPEDINTCTACNQGCFYYVFIDAVMGCMINPRVGNEWDPAYAINPVAKKKKVLIVGAGPSGMECARLAAIRGHDVTIVEKSDSIGGEVKLGVKSPLLYDWAETIRYYKAQIEKLGIKLKLNTEATADSIKAEAPEVLVIATGGKPSRPKIDGIDNKIVTNVFDVLEGKVKLGDKVVFIGGNEISIQTAEYVAEQGKEVTVLEKGKHICFDVNIFNILQHRRLMAKLNMKSMTNVTVNEITDDGVEISTAGGKDVSIEADTVVVAEGMDSEDTLAKAVGTTIAPEVYTIGDCAGVRKLYEAIHDGYKMGVKI
ncbi:MAG: 2-naphthoyl-CoA reductase [Proteobacteria bacterium]|nr:2-naphthoyl-CoA reductase [Pseudomonadota bacterium]